MDLQCTADNPGGLLRALRRYAGVSQIELAERMGVSKAVIAAIEAGERRARWDTIALAVKSAGCVLMIQTSEGAPLQAPHEAFDRFHARRLPAHAEPVPAPDYSNTANWVRDERYGRKRRHTFRHPKPHSRWSRWRNWRTAPGGPEPAQDVGDP